MKKVSLPKLLPLVALQALVMVAHIFAYSIVMDGAGYSAQWSLKVMIVQSLMLYGCLLLLASIADRRPSRPLLYILAAIEGLIFLSYAPAFLHLSAGILPLIGGLPAIMALVVAVMTVKKIMILPSLSQKKPKG